jgi:hypothetical protein
VAVTKTLSQPQRHVRLGNNKGDHNVTKLSRVSNCGKPQMKWATSLCINLIKNIRQPLFPQEVKVEKSQSQIRRRKKSEQVIKFSDFFKTCSENKQTSFCSSITQAFTLKCHATRLIKNG